MVSKSGILIFVAMTSLSVAAQGIRPQDVDLQRAIRAETVDGDTSGAIRQYGELADRYATSDPSVAAQALLRMARLYQATGDTRSRSTFERIVRNYPDQVQASAQARKALRGTGGRITQERMWAGDGTKGPVAISPDGRWIALDSPEGFVIRRNGSTEDYLSVPKADGPAFSADSKRIVYNQWDKGELRVASLEGRRDPRVVKANPSDVRYYNTCGWSPDGQSVLVEIVHQNWTKEIAWLSLATGETRILINLGRRRPQDPGERLSLSPNGQTIVYSAFPIDPGANAGPQAQERDRHLYVLPAQGGTPIELVAGNINVRPLWTRDGSHVVFVSNRSGSFALWSVKAGDSRESPVVEMPSSGRIVPIGITKNGALYFARNQTGIDLFVSDVRADGKVGAAMPLATRESGTNFTPVWSPDRRSIAYMRQRKDRPSARYALVVHAMSDHTERVFDSVDLRYGKPEWFADGTRVLVSDAGGRGSVLNVANGTFTPAADVLGFPASVAQSVSLSPDGKTAYVAQPVTSEGVEKGGRLVVNVNAVSFTVTAVDLATGTRRVVLPGNVGPRRSDIVLSPDGRSLAFITAKTGEQTGTLRIVGSDGQGLRDLSTSANVRMLAWAPDSQAIYFLEARGELSRMMRVLAKGGAPQDTGLTLPFDKQRGATLAGSQLVFAQESAVHELWVVKDFDVR